MPDRLRIACVQVISAELDRARVADVRRRLPSLASHRPGAYRWPASA